tara:strand:+ start:1269 stop:2372 length:1104 start_codon:yes stop_codon:yes gene_type:complete
MNILVTGANGFIGKNLCFWLAENNYSNILKIHRDSAEEDIKKNIEDADFIIHLAGVNRPKNNSDFDKGNAVFTDNIVQLLLDLKKKTPIIFASSTQAEDISPYGLSKLKAENIVKKYGALSGAKYYIYRLPNVFGKWCKPNYNSFIATFCHNISRNIPIEVHDPSAEISLVYIDDVCNSFLSTIEDSSESGYLYIDKAYKSSVGKVANLLTKFKDSRLSLVTEDVSNGMERALYATYLSHLETSKFHYLLEGHQDDRGIFCEFLKTKSAGQFSFFTAHVGITRGSHYHHSKSEKFLILQGKALFKFENIIDNTKYEIEVDSSELKVVESIPGWAHNIKNVGEDELIVMLWANEIFDKDQPDTIAKLI